MRGSPIDDATRNPLQQPLPSLPGAAPSFSTSYRVRTADVDQQMNLRLDGMARYLQDIAYDNIEAADFAASDPFWVVRRTVIDVLEPISWPGTVTLERWCSALSTRWANMRVRLTAEHDTNAFNPRDRPAGLIETEAFWINVNSQGMPTRISDGGFDMLATMTDAHRLRWHAINPGQLPDPDDPAVPPDRPHVLRSTDFDPLKHVNNAAYLAAVEEELVDHPDLRTRPHRTVIEYLRPIPPGAGVTIRRRWADGLLQMWMVVDGKVAATASVAAAPHHA